jgi:23S rRNA pseudouridine1911/1915/1917 synthase
MQTEYTAEKSGRLDLLLVDMLGLKYSRHRVKKGIENGAVYINGKLVKKADSKIRIGTVIVFDKTKLPKHASELRLVPSPETPLNIIYEDDDCLVINKQAGILTHPTNSRFEKTLAGALLARYPKLSSVGENDIRPGIVHRLDEWTSGLLVVAKTKSAFEFLKRQFMKREVLKVYLAIVEGVLDKKEGLINYAIRPSSTNPAKRVAVKTPA